MKANSIEYLEEKSYSDFLGRHNLRDSSLLQRDILLIYWTSFANIILHQAYSKISEESFESEPSVGLLLTMLDRVFEHVEGAIVAFNTGNSASAEVISRTAIESSVTVRYILANERTARLAAYFEDYISTVEVQVKRWRNLIDKMTGNEAQAHQEAIKSRTEYLNKMREIVESETSVWRNVAKSRTKLVWPQNIRDQFAQIDEETFYRTIYARLCSQTHGDAEDVLGYYLMVSIGNQELLEKAAVEAVNYSRFMVYIALQNYLKAVLRYSEVFQLDLSESIDMGLTIIEYQLKEISLEIGA